MINTGRTLATAALALLPTVGWSAPAQLTVRAVNRIQLARPGQTVELSAAQLASIGEKDLSRIHVMDSAGKELLAQAVDTDGDYSPDQVIFQADFAAGEARSFTISSAAKQIYTREQFKAYGRFVRERFDDFAWENDRIAHRMYGKALETWVHEPLTSSTVDIWSKRIGRMVINDWYMVDNYHADTGEGADFYSAGPSRGCGGNGLWADEKLWVSRNFVNSRVLANGPIRVMFELTYEPFDVSGTKVAEIKRITLDAGQNLDHFRSFYKPQSPGGALATAIGLKKVAGERVEFNENRGFLAKWESVEKKAGSQGLAIVVEPKTFRKRSEDRLNHLLISTVGTDNVGGYWAGFCWDKAGQFRDFNAWLAYLDSFSQSALSPIEVTVAVQ
jgi:hypothetical protein